jgi:S1-C subfamily serine protease
MKKSTVELEKSIFQITANHASHSYVEPWNLEDKGGSTSSAFCIKHEGVKYILTNSHCVEDANYISLKKRGSAKMFKANIESIMYECDLALLSLDVSREKNKKALLAEFWDDIPALEIGGLPSKLDEVYVYGYPLGGYNISITSGTVSRIDFEASSSYKFLCIQTDAAINSGNSGGPVLDKNGIVIGVAFASMSGDVQNMGFVIPTTLVRYFLESFSYHRKHKTKFYSLMDLGIDWIQSHNKILREYNKIDQNAVGIFVAAVDEFGASAKELHKMDFITHINNKVVDNKGNMLLRDIILDNDDYIKKHDAKSALLDSTEMAPFMNIIRLKQPNEVVQLTVIRKNKEHKINIKLKHQEFLIPILKSQLQPSYYILYGMVFIPFSVMMYEEKKENREHLSSLYRFFYGKKKSPDQQLVVLSQNTNYELQNFVPRSANIVLKSINGVKINNIKHLYDTVHHQIQKSDYLELNFYDYPGMVLLKVDDIIKKQQKIIFDNFDDIPDIII